MISMHKLTNPIGIDNRRRDKKISNIIRTHIRTICVYICVCIYAFLRAYASRGWVLN